jgi:hypothetical protein
LQNISIQNASQLRGYTLTVLKLLKHYSVKVTAAAAYAIGLLWGETNTSVCIETCMHDPERRFLPRNQLQQVSKVIQCNNLRILCQIPQNIAAQGSTVC